MKTLCITVILFTFSLLMTAQGDTDIIKNITYVNEVVSYSESIKINKMQNMVANFNIKEAKGFDTKKKGTYDVVFKETNCKIEATYNSKGEILNSMEIYEDMRLPIGLTKRILTDNSKWHVVNNVQIINYNYGKDPDMLYEVMIRKENEFKMLKFKIQNKANKDYVVLN